MRVGKARWAMIVTAPNRFAIGQMMSGMRIQYQTNNTTNHSAQAVIVNEFMKFTHDE